MAAGVHDDELQLAQDAHAARRQLGAVPVLAAAAQGLAQLVLLRSADLAEPAKDVAKRLPHADLVLEDPQRKAALLLAPCRMQKAGPIFGTAGRQRRQVRERGRVDEHDVVEAQGDPGLQRQGSEVGEGQAALGPTAQGSHGLGATALACDQRRTAAEAGQARRAGGELGTPRGVGAQRQH